MPVSGSHGKYEIPDSRFYIPFGQARPPGALSPPARARCSKTRLCAPQVRAHSTPDPPRRKRPGKGTVLLCMLCATGAQEYSKNEQKNGLSFHGRFPFFAPRLQGFEAVFFKGSFLKLCDEKAVCFIYMRKEGAGCEPPHP